MVTGTSVGIDYHEEMLQVCVLNGDGELGVNRQVSKDVEAVIRG